MKTIAVVGPSSKEFRDRVAERLSNSLGSMAYVVACAGNVSSPTTGPETYSDLLACSPDVLVICVDPIEESTQTDLLASLSEEIALTLRLAHVANMRACVGAIAVDTSAVTTSLKSLTLARYARYGFTVYDGIEECAHLMRLAGAQPNLASL